jgi:hypothetical protein
MPFWLIKSGFVKINNAEKEGLGSVNLKSLGALYNSLLFD